ncbi:C1 family peptidase [Methanobrevibacter sp. DSM 116169]|uniref:C1 family peptidase n=1 Tax=Methanobrevibacter sp. DSM 116169 TaxID=3242727 RepID=UPI0038FC5F1D
MEKKKILLFCIVFLFSVGLVSAEDGNFTELGDKIINAGDDNDLELDKNYTHNSNEDNNGIIIDNDNFLLDGKGYTIDGNNQSRVFLIRGNNVTIMNLNIINGLSTIGGAIGLAGTNLTIKNVNFINNYATVNGGAIYFEDATLFIEDSDFINNKASKGAALYAYSSNYNINNGKFIGNNATWGAIFSQGSEGVISNSIFVNASSKYSAAIHAISGNLTVFDSTFVDLFANETAGAIGIKNGNGIIINSTFNNVESEANGGAIFIDVSDSYTSLTVGRSNFTDCYSGFGGAIVSLNTMEDGFLIIFDSNFINNSALFDGGAIFTSFANVTILRSNFTGNKNLYDGERGAFGGALYLDMSGAFIENSTFLNNGLESDYSLGGAIYSYDTDLLLNNNVFKNNTAFEGTAIFSHFGDEIILNDNYFNNDTISVNNTNYVCMIMGDSVKIELINNSIVVENLPIRFDLRDFGWVSPVKNQGGMGACWAFGTIAALESALLKSAGLLYDFSENNMQDAMLKYSIYGSADADEGGLPSFLGVGYLLNWFGALPTEHDTYDELGKISPLIVSSIHIQDVILVPARNGSLDNDLIKDAVIKYGALTVGISMQFDPIYLNDNGAFYYDGTDPCNHAVAIVGWDDNYSKDNFAITPPGDGAFIIKNSYGTNMGDKGYYYVSYYDTQFCSFLSVGIIFNNTIAYNKNYQYDWTGKSESAIAENDSYYYYANEYISYGQDLIAAVGTYFEEYDNDYELFVYVNDELKYSQIGKTYYPGFSTIKLDQYIPIKEGDLFKVVIKSKSVPFMKADETRVHLVENVSFFSDDGENWEDLYDSNVVACLKVYTVAYDVKEVFLNADNFTMYYKDGSQFIVTLLDALGNPLDNKTVNITINGVSYLKKTNESGIASLNINLNPGNYSVSVFFDGGDEFNNASIENYIDVESTFISKDLIKFYKNGTQFDVTVFGLNGDVLADVNVTFNINGVLYNRTTNSSGVARLNINLNPGNYTITTSFNGLSLGNNIEVKSIVYTSNLVKTFGNNETYDVLVFDGQGNPLKNVTVKININGVFYYRITGSDGIAKLNINLDPGSYIATVNYNEYATSNNVTVKS